MKSFHPERKRRGLELYGNERKYLLVVQTGRHFACAHLRATIANKSSIRKNVKAHHNDAQ